MLFHITATHTEDNCPGYNRELMPPMLDAIEGSGDLAKELGLTFCLWLVPLPNMLLIYLWKQRIVQKLVLG